MPKKAIKVSEEKRRKAHKSDMGRIVKVQDMFKLAYNFLYKKRLFIQKIKGYLRLEQDDAFIIFRILNLARSVHHNHV